MLIGSKNITIPKKIQKKNKFISNLEYCIYIKPQKGKTYYLYYYNKILYKQQNNNIMILNQLESAN